MWSSGATSCLPDTGGGRSSGSIPLAGGLEQLIRWHATPDEVTAADHDRYMAKRSEFLARYEGSPDALFAFPSLREFPRVPTHKPFFDRFLIDDAGNIWARHFPSTGLGIQDLRPPRDPAPPETWTALDSAGVWLGPVHLPDGFAAHEVANGRVYGVHTSALGTQTVRVYRLARARGEQLRSQEMAGSGR